MAVTSTVNSNTLTVKLNNGRDEQGKQKLVNVNLVNIKKEPFSAEDMQKAINITNALGTCFYLPIYTVQLATTTILTTSA